MGHSLGQGTYNLLDEKWIPVLYGDGRVDRVGICNALKDAGKIRQIAASNPMDRVALLRFLLAILMWCREDVKSALLALDVKSAGIPENWLARLKEHKDAFSLLGGDNRFYQDASTKGKESRPIADLLFEFPGADSVNHMCHVVHDGSYGFCPACCALGILRLSVWAPANRYYPASVNPSSAAYAFIEGKNLLQTLCANLPKTNQQVDQAPWLSNDQPNSPDAVAKLAWRPRKLWLNVGDKEGFCANCGRLAVLVINLCNEGGWPTPTTDGQKFAKAIKKEFKKFDFKAKNKTVQQVVKMAEHIRRCRMPMLQNLDKGTDQTVQQEPDEQKFVRIFKQLFETKNEKAIKELTMKETEEEKQQVGVDVTQMKKFWRDDPHLLQKNGEAISLPELKLDVSMHSTKFWRDALFLQREPIGKVTAIGPVVNRFTFQDGVSVTLPVASDAVKKRAKLCGDCSNRLHEMLKCTTQNHQRKHPEIYAALKLLSPHAESHIREGLNRFNTSTGDSSKKDKEFLCEVYAPLIKLVVASVTPGSPLRRCDAMNHAHALLYKNIKEMVEKQDHQPTAGPPTTVRGKPKRNGKKGGSK